MGNKQKRYSEAFKISVIMDMRENYLSRREAVHKYWNILLAEHNITQSMSRRGNCMDNEAMENFFGRLKVEMFYGEHFQTVDAFINCLKDYIDYCSSERIISELKMSSVQYRTHSLDS